MPVPMRLAPLRARAVCRLALAFALALPACSHRGHCAQISVEVSGDHAHSAKVSADKIRRGVGGTYVVHGADHDHLFVLKDEDAQKLERGESVSVRTTSTNAHVHQVTLRCKN